MKKLLSIVLALSLCLTAMMGCFVVSAETTNTVTVETVEIETGTATTEVDVTFDFDETFAASQFTVNFGALELTGISAPETVALSHNATADGTEDDFSVLNGSITCILDAANAEELGAFNEVVITLTFNTADLTANNYAITFTGDVASAGTYDGTWTGDEKMLDYTATAGAIVVVDPCTHENVTYTNNGDDHTVACAACDYTATEPHNYVDGECVCGAVEVTEPEEPVYDESIKFASANLSLAESLSINFKVNPAVINTLTDPYVIFQFAKCQDGTITGYDEITVTFAETTFDTTNNRYVYSLKGVFPQFMTRDVIATIYGTREGVLYVGKPQNYGVTNYVVNKLKNKTVTTPELTALVDMIYYGDAAQNYTGYNKNNLASDMVTQKLAEAGVDSTTWKSFASEGEPSFTPVKGSVDLEGATVRIKSAKMLMSDVAVIQFVCTELDKTTALTPDSGYYVHVTYTNLNDYERVFDIALDEDGIANFDKLYASEFFLKVTAVLRDVNGNDVSNTVTYSVADGAAAVKDTEAIKPLTDALVVYGNAVTIFAKS